jgi:hypothetical protein
VIDYLCENLMLMKPLLQREKLFWCLLYNNPSTSKLYY